MFDRVFNAPLKDQNLHKDLKHRIRLNGNELVGFRHIASCKSLFKVVRNPLNANPTKWSNHTEIAHELFECV